jgi:hypothetical protein
MLKLFTIIVMLSVACIESSFAQEVSTANVNIVSIKAEIVKDRFVCTTDINNFNDDDAYNTKLIVLLPVQTQRVTNMKVTGGRGHCTAPPPLGGPSGFVEYVTCSLGHLPQGPTVRRTITITTTPSTADPVYKRTCSAFIYSRSGDIDQTNNYATAVAP